MASLELRLGETLLLSGSIVDIRSCPGLICAWLRKAFCPSAGKKADSNAGSGA